MFKHVYSIAGITNCKLQEAVSAAYTWLASNDQVPLVLKDFTPELHLFFI